MAEFYIEATSFAAPFFSDISSGYVDAPNATHALEQYAESYAHPCGLYAAVAYTSADAKNKGEKPIAKWLCNHEIERMRLTADKGAYSYLGHGPGDFEIDGERFTIAEPKSGRVI